MGLLESGQGPWLQTPQLWLEGSGVVSGKGASSPLSLTQTVKAQPVPQESWPSQTLTRERLIKKTMTATA